MAADDPEQCAAIEEQARIIVSDVEREVPQPADRAFTHAEVQSLLHTVATRQPRPHPPGSEPDGPPAPAPPT